MFCLFTDPHKWKWVSSLKKNNSTLENNIKKNLIRVHPRIEVTFWKLMHYGQLGKHFSLQIDPFWIILLEIFLFCFYTLTKSILELCLAYLIFFVMLSSEFALLMLRHLFMSRLKFLFIFYYDLSSFLKCWQVLLNKKKVKVKFLQLEIEFLNAWYFEKVNIHNSLFPKNLSTWFLYSRIWWSPNDVLLFEVLSKF